MMLNDIISAINESKKIAKPIATISEAKMSPSRLRGFLKSPYAIDIRGGFEAELIFTGLNMYSRELTTLDYSKDFPIRSFADITEMYDRRGITSADAFDDVSNAEQNYTHELDKFMEEEAEMKFKRNELSLIEYYLKRVILQSNDPYYRETIQEIIGNHVTQEHMRDMASSNSEDFGYIVDSIYNRAGRAATNLWHDIRDTAMTDIGTKLTEYDFLKHVMRKENLITAINVLERFGDTENWPWKTLSSAAAGLANSLKELTGQPWHAGNYKPNSWGFVYDGSLMPEKIGETGIEIVSPVMSLSDMIDLLPKFFDWAKEHGAYTNKSCGFHVNLSISNFDTVDFDPLKAALLQGDSYILEVFDRATNDYTQGIERLFSKAYARSPRRTLYAIKSLKQGLDAASSEVVNLYGSAIHEKYLSIHMKDKYVEFRSPGNASYMEDIDKMTDTIARFCYGLIAGTNPEFERREYAKKLFKFLDKRIPSTDVTIPFSMYRAGIITTEQLRAELEKISDEKKFAKENS